MDTEQGKEVVLLTELEVPRLLNDQLAEFSESALHAIPTRTFDVTKAVAQLKENEGMRVLGADFGGDKGSTRLFEVQNGRLVIVDDYADDIQGNDGAGYVDSLKKSAAYAEANKIPLGISWGGPLKNESELVYHPKAKLFMNQMAEQFGSSLKNISPSVKATLNDGPAGLIQGAVEAYRSQGSTTVLFVINGGGLGLAVLHGNTIYATEAGHVKGVEALNVYDQLSECGVFDAKHICLEQLGANKAGIETQWQNAVGSYMRARDIEDRYKEGNILARDLYDHSAQVVAHMIQGTANCFDIGLSSPDTSIVCHGGSFKFPDYGERIRQILSQHAGNKVQLVMTKDYTDTKSNACIDGAAIAALTT